MYSSDCLTNRLDLGCVSTATGIHRSYCLINRSDPGCVFTATSMYGSDCLTNRTALVCVSTATLHVHFGLFRQQSSAGMYFHGRATFRTVSPTQQFWNVFPRLPLPSTATLTFHGYPTVRTVSPTQQYCDV